MKTKYSKIIVLILLYFISLNSNAQVPDIDCLPNTFFGVVGNSTHRFQWNGSLVQDLGVIAASTYPSTYSLAYGYDILNNSTNRTLYSTVNVFQTPCAIIRYNGAGWDTVATDSLIFHNAGGNGRFLYFQHLGGSVDECIKRLNPDGSLTEIFNDTSQFVFTVSDIAVDSVGNIYCFRGSAIGNTSEITKLDSSGNILNNFATNLNNLTGLYGAMFFNGTLYVGQTTQQLFPVIFSGTTASLGTSVSTPSGISMLDLANCHEIIETGINDPENGFYEVYFNNAGNSLEIFNPYQNREPVKIFGTDGRLVYNGYCDKGNNSYNISGWRAGVYFIVIGDNKNTFVQKIGVLNTQ